MTGQVSQKEISGSESAKLWKRCLSGKMPPSWEKEIGDFETEMFLKKQGKIEDKVFAETRLRRGVYGQRYDNGKRHDGKEDRPIPYPTLGKLSKGPMTEWDAPGMQRIKIPWGGLNPDQMDVLADLAEEYSDSICHVTTRQDIQLHYVHIEDTPSIFRRLAAMGITTREACGNSVRNVTACPIAGVCSEAAFDVTPYADAMFRFALAHPDIQDFGRKFKIAFSGCKNNPCGLVTIHDMGYIAAKKIVDGVEKKGFEMVVGGGLGPLPYQAKLFSEFIPVEEMLPLAQAVWRIYARYGEKKKRNRARIKFLVADWGIEKFKQMVMDERAKLPVDPRWKELISPVEKYEERPLKTPSATRPLTPSPQGRGDYERWLKTNVRPQRQEGYYLVVVSLPLGDITSNQMRDLAAIARKYIRDTVRTTVEQNIVLRWVAEGDLPALYDDLKKIDLAQPFAGTIVDITACPGTDTCKLGVSSSRGLAGELRTRLAEKSVQMNEAVRNLHIKISGCFNSCGQHHIADIGFYGVSRKVGNYVVPHFQLILGGQWTENAASYGMAVVGIPSKNIPAVVDRLGEMYVKGRQGDEKFQAFIQRVEKIQLKKALEDLTVVPSHDENPSFYVDWGDVREYTISDIGKGECAGEVVSLTDFGLKAADRELFEAQVQFEAGNLEKTASLAFHAMATAAQGLIKGQNPDVSNDPEKIIIEFKTRFCDTEIFYDRFARDQFANYLFRAQAEGPAGLNKEKTQQRIEEAQLFIDAAYNCHARMSMEQTSPLP
ncbi:MAG: nitrite/sulfite reductase [Deltaproteobacteria bacterium]|nr:nitrite/sulfite reductase [Deltaproteobacteria bacterium]